MTLGIQALTMLHMLGAGIVIGTSLDTYRRLRFIKGSRWLTFIQDLLFWLSLAVITFLWLKSVNEGEMRVYVFLSLLCGYAMYKALFEALYRRLLDRTIELVIVLYRFVKKMFYYLLIKPLILLYQFLMLIIITLTGFLFQLGKGLYRLLMKIILFLSRPLVHFVKGLVKGWKAYWLKRQKEKKRREEEMELEQQKLIEQKKQLKLKTTSKSSSNEKKIIKKEGFFAGVAKWLFRK